MTTTDDTQIDIKLDPTRQRMSGRAAHGNTPFDVPYISEIDENLWQGGCAEGMVLPNFIKSVVSLYPWESYRLHSGIGSVLSVWMHDSVDQDMGQVDSIAHWVNDRRGVGPVLVHCQAGLNRSSLVVARALILDGLSPAAAIHVIRQRRSPACLCNPAFEQWLVKS